MPHSFAFIHFILFIIKEVLSRNNTEVFAISTEGCVIRSFPLVSEEIENIVGLPRAMRNCSETVQLVNSNFSHIWVIREAFEYFNINIETDFYCCYINFYANGNMENIIYGNCKEFSTTIKAEHQFVRIECYYLGIKLYEDVLLFQIDEVVYEKNHDEGTYNVLIFGLESMSRMNFHRSMPVTSLYLQQKGSIELLGYNKVGDNSFPNLFPALTDNSFEFARRTCIDRDNVIDITSCPFVWDKFNKSGYYTALGSDSIAGLLGIYEYSLTVIPTDFYLLPFMFETGNMFRDPHYSFHMCLGSKFFYKILLQYIHGLTSKLQFKRLFGMFWEQSVSHEHLNYPHIMDEDYVKVLKVWEESGYLNETILILLGDHGMRTDKIILTKQGRMEDRLPLLRLLIPESFKRRYKLAYRNLRDNQHRLTTPYDIYETLTDLINPKVLEDCNIRMRSRIANISRSSLFLPVPELRTCDLVGIKEHWCTCYKGKKVRAGHKTRVIAARYLIDHINKLLNAFPQCHKLSIKRILEVTVVRNKGNSGRTYTVVVETSPGGGILDGTLHRERELWAVSGTVSRLNLYHNHTCINDFLVKMYCFCS